MNGKRYMSAREAAAELGINLKTLYAYVSRGEIRSESMSGSRRMRAYLAEDVQRLKERKEIRQHPEKVASKALQWGDPVLDSELTLVRDDRVYYCGREVVFLADSWTIEQVATLFWEIHGTDEDILQKSEQLFARRKPEQTLVQEMIASYTQKPMGQLTPLEQFQVALSWIMSRDLAAYTTDKEAMMATGARLLWLLTAVLTHTTTLQPTIASMLQQRWAPDDEKAIHLLDAALILNADNELTIPAFTARCAASAGTTLYGAIQAALAALQGTESGSGRQLQMLQFLREVRRPQQVRQVLATRLKQGTPIPGFWHQLFPTGDSRPLKLLELLRNTYSNELGTQVAWALIDEMKQHFGIYPRIELAYAALAYVFHLTDEEALALFALARCVGCIGHALEQYSSGQQIRPRARYIGRQPMES